MRFILLGIQVKQGLSSDYKIQEVISFVKRESVNKSAPVRRDRKKFWDHECGDSILSNEASQWFCRLFGFLWIVEKILFRQMQLLLFCQGILNLITILITGKKKVKTLDTKQNRYKFTCRKLKHCGRLSKRVLLNGELCLVHDRRVWLSILYSIVKMTRLPKLSVDSMPYESKSQQGIL